MSPLAGYRSTLGVSHTELGIFIIFSLGVVVVPALLFLPLHALHLLLLPVVGLLHLLDLLL